MFNKICGGFSLNYTVLVHSPLFNVDIERSP